MPDNPEDDFQYIEPHDTTVQDIFIGPCLACMNPEVLVKEIPLGTYCFNCLPIASRIKQVPCPVCGQIIRASQVQKHQLTCTKVKSHRRLSRRF